MAKTIDATAVAEALADITAQKAEEKALKQTKPLWPAVTPCHMPLENAFRVVCREWYIMSVCIPSVAGEERYFNLNRGINWIPGDSSPEAFNTPFFRALKNEPDIEDGAPKIEVYAPDQPLRIDGDLRQLVGFALTKRPHPKDAHNTTDFGSAEALAALLPILKGNPRQHDFIKKRVDLLLEWRANTPAPKTKARPEKSDDNGRAEYI